MIAANEPQTGAQLDANRLLTEPLSAVKLAHYFRVGRHCIPDLIGRMPGVEMFGCRYCVPLHRMPPAYLLATGLVRPRAVPPNWPESADPAMSRPSAL